MTQTFAADSKYVVHFVENPTHICVLCPPMQETHLSPHLFEARHILQIKKETRAQSIMPRRKRMGSLAQKWMNTKLSENVNSLTKTVTALELEACSSPTTEEGFDLPNDDHSFGEEPVTDEPETTTPNSLSSHGSETDEESESEDAVGNISTTVAQQVQMHFGINNSGVNDDDLNSNDECTINLSPLDCATLDVLKLCHNAGCSLEFYDLLFALLQNAPTH